MPVTRLEELKELARLKLASPMGAHTAGTHRSSLATWAFTEEELVDLMAEFAYEETDQEASVSVKEFRAAMDNPILGDNAKAKILATASIEGILEIADALKELNVTLKGKRP